MTSFKNDYNAGNKIKGHMPTDTSHVMSIGSNEEDESMENDPIFLKHDLTAIDSIRTSMVEDQINLAGGFDTNRELLGLDQMVAKKLSNHVKFDSKIN